MHAFYFMCEAEWTSDQDEKILYFYFLSLASCQTSIFALSRVALRVRKKICVCVHAERGKKDFRHKYRLNKFNIIQKRGRRKIGNIDPSVFYAYFLSIYNTHMPWIKE